MFGHADITGTVFQDFNGNGVKDSGVGLDNTGQGSYDGASDCGISGVTITAFAKDGSSTSSTIDTAGHYTIPTSAGVYRIEFSNLPAGYFPGAHSSASGNLDTKGNRPNFAGSSVQFASDGTVNVNLALLAPSDYCQD